MARFVYINKGSRSRPDKTVWQGAVIVGDRTEENELFGEYKSRLEDKLALADTQEERDRVTVNWWMRWMSGQKPTEWRGSTYGDRLEADVIENPSEEILAIVRAADYGK